MPRRTLPPKAFDIVRKEVIEAWVSEILRHILRDTENRACIAVDISTYYREHYVNTHYLDGLKDELAATSKSIDNLVRAIEQGLPFTQAVGDRLNENEERKGALVDAIEAEEARERAAQDESSIRAFFEKYSNADLCDPTVRDIVLDYFVDKIFLYEDRIVLTVWYTDLHHEMVVAEHGDRAEGDEGFEYLPESSSGFVYLADRGTTLTKLSISRELSC